MSQFFKETAHTKTDMKKYGDNYDHIFRKYKCNCHLFENQVCDVCQENKELDKCKVLTPDSSQ